MGRRAERVDETRERITEAAVRLHTTVGLSRASIAAIAEAAGVTSLRFIATSRTSTRCTRRAWPTGPPAIPDRTPGHGAPSRAWNRARSRLRRAVRPVPGAR